MITAKSHFTTQCCVCKCLGSSDACWRGGRFRNIRWLFRLTSDQRKWQPRLRLLIWLLMAYRLKGALRKAESRRTKIRLADGCKHRCSFQSIMSGADPYRSVNGLKQRCTAAVPSPAWWQFSHFTCWSCVWVNKITSLLDSNQQSALLRRVWI